MYKVFGADQQEYGPAGTDQIQSWIQERRLNGQSLVRAQGSDQWRPLSEFPEFQSVLAQLAIRTDRAEPPAALGGFDYPPAEPRTNVLAVLGFIMGLLSLSLGCCCYGLPFNVLGLVFSVLGLSQIRQDPGRERGHSLALAGLILCLLSLLLAALGFLFGVALGLGRHGMWR